MKRWCAWLRQVWAEESVAEGVEVASPVLARRVEAVCAGQRADARQVRRMVSSVTRYLLRMRGRATPFGLFAGVAAVRFGPELTVRWGGLHCAVARADAAWLTDVITQLESCPQLLARLSVVTNNLCFVRGGRLVVPYQPHMRGPGRAVPAEVSMRHTRAVQIVVQAARSPIRCDELARKLAAGFPSTPGSVIDGLLAELVARRVLVSGLHAPTTVTDAFGYVLDALTAVDAGDIPQVAPRLWELRVIQAELALHNRVSAPGTNRGVRKSVADRMRAVSNSAEQPLAMDLRLDCEIVLPKQVAWEVEAAASVLMRLTAHPFGTEDWQDYHEKFLVRLTEPLHVDGELVPGWWSDLDPSGQPSENFPGGHGNFGMAHGISGPLALLSLTMKRGVIVDGHAGAIGRICAWLDGWRQDHVAGPWWPEWVTREEFRNHQSTRVEGRVITTV